MAFAIPSIDRQALNDNVLALANAVLVGAVTPLMLKTASNPDGLPTKAFDDIREDVAAGRTKLLAFMDMRDAHA